jgi:hypothetical protein
MFHFLFPTEFLTPYLKIYVQVHYYFTAKQNEKKLVYLKTFYKKTKLSI